MKIIVHLIMKHISIYTTHITNNSINYFSNVTELTFGRQYCDALNDLTAIAFNRIFLVSQLTKLTIQCRFFPFQQLILRYTQ